MENNVDVLIIGAGPAGLTAGIYAARAEKKVLIIEKGAPGGKMNNTHMISNYPGLEGKHGFEFSMSFVEQAKKFGAEIKGGEVIEVTNLESSDSKLVKLANGEEFTTKTVIIASGLNPKKLDVPGYDEYFGKGISTCLVCDGAFYRGKDVAVVGGGNSATEESLFAADFVGNIHILNSFPTFRAEEITLEKLKEKNNIHCHYNTVVKEIKGQDGKVASIVVEEDGTEKEIEVQGIFTYVGWDVTATYIKDPSILDEDGYLIVNPENNETKIPGVYAAGDIIPKPFRQVTISASDGTKAALAAVDYINKL